MARQTSPHLIHYSMPNCAACFTAFKNFVLVDGKIRNLQRRKYCISCSPFGGRNTKKLVVIGHAVVRLRSKAIGCKQCGDAVLKNRIYCVACKALGKHLHTKTLEDMVSPFSIRRYLLRSRPRKCQSCNTAKWLGKPVPLDVDHIDGNHKNNSEDNLRLICPNCHALTATYKSRNRGNGRAFRRQRYAEGKTY